MHRSMLVALMTMLAWASCGGEKPTEPDPLGESPAVEAERIDALAFKMSWAMKHSRPDPAKSRAIVEMLERIVRNEPGGAQPAPPLSEYQKMLEEDIFEFAERYKGNYELVHEQVKRRIGEDELWGRSFRQGELGQMQIVPASDGPLDDNEIQALKTLPALLFYGKDGTLERKYALVSLEKQDVWGLVIFYWMACVMYEDGVLVAHNIYFVSDDRISLEEVDAEVQDAHKYAGTAAWNPFFGYNAVYWRK